MNLDNVFTKYERLVSVEGCTKNNSDTEERIVYLTVGIILSQFVSPVPAMTGGHVGRLILSVSMQRGREKLFFLPGSAVRLSVDVIERNNYSARLFRFRHSFWGEEYQPLFCFLHRSPTDSSCV